MEDPEKKLRQQDSKDSVESVSVEKAANHDAEGADVYGDSGETQST